MPERPLRFRRLKSQTRPGQTSLGNGSLCAMISHKISPWLDTRRGTLLAVLGRHIRVLRCEVAGSVFQHSKPNCR
jgi:hypothetical protein